MLCQRLKSYTPNICLQRGRVYCFYHVHFPRCLFGLPLFYSLSLSSCSLLIHFPLVVWVSNFFFRKHFFTTIHLYHVHFPRHWVCIALLFVVVLLFSTCSFPLLLFRFSIFLSLNIFFAIIHLFPEYGY